MSKTTVFLGNEVVHVFRGLRRDASPPDEESFSTMSTLCLGLLRLSVDVKYE